MSFLEVYNEEVCDLLSKSARKQLDVREHGSGGVYVKGLTAIVVRSASEMDKVLEVSNACHQCMHAIGVRQSWLYTGCCHHAVLPLLQVGKRNRSVGATLMNQESSRSHSIFTVTVETADGIAGQAGSPRHADAAVHI